ncbi:MAG TPA: Hsp70 family protein [Bryobacteraceae bacterium]|nr:Hsp70 family protein [Bryobacteraceae bacterium]
MGKAIGIDLGTTNSVAAIRVTDTRPIQNKENEDLTRSVVGVYKGQEYVGRLAVSNMKLAPKDTILSIKRLMGRAFRDPEVQKARQKYLYQIVEPAEGTDDDVCVLMGGKQYSPVEISAKILTKIKNDAKLRLNDDVEYAVITVPAYFTDKQRSATRQAGRLAGLKVQKILDEPSAAAIAFGIDNLGPEDARTVVVYDLGGGTFDVSVLTIVGGILEPLNIAGDMWLGGDDFDFRIMEHVIDHVKAIHQIDPRQDSQFMAELRKEAEEAKKTLTAVKAAQIIINGMLQNEDRDLIDVNLEITVEKFEHMIAPRIQESIDLVQDAIKGSQLTVDDIDHVLLVGGSSSIPLVRRELAKVFGEKKLMMNIDPMKCVAFGAAILSAKLAQTWECAKCKMRNEGKDNACRSCGEPSLGTLTGIGTSTGMHYGIETEGGSFGIIIPKGSTFPTPEPIVRRFLIPTGSLKRLKVPIYAGFNPVAAENELQAIVWLELPDKVSANTPVDVAFSLDEDGILNKVKVSLRDGSGAEVESYLDRGDSRRSRLEKKLEQLRKQGQSAPAFANNGGAKGFEEFYGKAASALNRNDAENAEAYLKQMAALLAGPGWREQATTEINYAEHMVATYEWLIEAPQAARIKQLVEELKVELNAGNQGSAEAKTKELASATDALPKITVEMRLVEIAFMRANAAGKAVEADKIRVAYRDIESALRRNDLEAARTAYGRITDLLDLFLKDQPGWQPGSIGVLKQ